MSKAKPSILFVGPDLQEVGGVSLYCQSILSCYPGPIEYFGFPLGMKRNPLVFLRILLAFIKALGDGPPRLVHLNTSLNTSAIARDAVFLLLSLCLGRKVVVFIHGWESTFQHSLRGFKLAFFRALFARASAIAVLSREFKGVLEGWGFPGRIVVAHTCYSGTLGKREVPSSEDTTSRGRRLLYLSRVVKEKGVFELISACERLLPCFPDLELDIVGEGPALPELREWVVSRGLSFVRLHGLLVGQAKREMFEAAHLFCLPTYYGEGLPVCLLEAMALGLPIVTTRVGGIPDIFEEGRNGLFVEPRDVVDLAEKLGRLLAEPVAAAAIARANVEYAQTNFSPSVIAERLAGLHEECCAA